MIDLSRNFIPAVDVGEVIDLAAWRKLNVVHLHLTDDEGWRIPIAAYPALADVATSTRPRRADPAAAQLRR